MTQGLMQPGPTLYEAEQRRKKKGSQGLLGEVGEPLSYAPGPLGLLGNALLSAQYLTGEKPMDEGLSGLSMMTALMQGTKVAPIMRNAIKVYHGSPHKFDKADSSKIGTGEGAQAYGHGLYWAENKGVAEDYAKRLDPSRWDFTYTVGGKPVTPRDKDWLLAQMIGDKGKDAAIAEQRKQIAEAIQKVGPDNKVVKVKESVLQQILDFPDVVKTGKLKGESNLYEANLRWPDPAREAADPLSAKHFLDWDKPLSEQGNDVQRALIDAANSQEGRSRFADSVRGGDSGMLSYKNLVGQLWKGSGVTEKDAQESASNMLSEYGIPGITYLDAGSRAAGQGTRNYVTFDDALVELLKRNGMGLLGK